MLYFFTVTLAVLLLMLSRFVIHKLVLQALRATIQEEYGEVIETRVFTGSYSADYDSHTICIIWHLMHFILMLYYNNADCSHPSSFFFGFSG